MLLTGSFNSNRLHCLKPIALQTQLPAPSAAQSTYRAMWKAICICRSLPLLQHHMPYSSDAAACDIFTACAICELTGWGEVSSSDMFVSSRSSRCVGAGEATRRSKQCNEVYRGYLCSVSTQRTRTLMTMARYRRSNVLGFACLTRPLRDSWIHAKSAIVARLKVQ
jgi:hypothetical protein